LSAKPEEFLQRKIINGWNLWLLITVPISIAVVIAMSRVDLAQAENVSSMIQFTVRCAVPLVYVVFAASALQVLFPSPFGRWLLLNRKYVGLSFAVAMGWQLLFILWLVGIHTEHYVEQVYLLSDAIEGVAGYTFLLAMVLTSFKFGRSRLSGKQWKLLHRTAIYYIWAYAWSVYWFDLFYYDNPVLIDYVYYWAGFLAWGLRMCAWSKKQMRHTAVEIPA